MGFSFLHTADWQIGKPFRNFPDRVAGRLESARLDAIDRLAEAARRRGIANVLVAGDIWDSERLTAKEERQPLARMAKHTDTTWVLIPGNHDAARAGSVWTRLAARGLPDNVVPLVEPVPHSLARDVVILPAPLTSRAPAGDPTAWMDGVATAAGAVRLGLAHGSVRGFGSGDEGESEALIDAARAKRAGLDYLALGDWHGTTRINARTWYSGTPEPDRFRDNEAGEALAVTIAGAGAEPVVERVATGHFAWVTVRAAITAGDDLERLGRDIRGRGVSLDRVILRLTLTGALPAKALYRIETWSEALRSEVAHLDVDAAGVGIAGDAADPDLFGTQGELRMAADRLAAMAAGGDAAAAADAAVALRRLVAILAEVREGGR